MADKYKLSWHTNFEYLQMMLKDLYQEGRYSDVTLVSDDQTQFKAHKIVLSVCSPVFKKIIEGNPSQHPLIYLRGIQSFEIESILQFMYLGEGKFYQERMREFLKVAQDLQIKEISDGVKIQDKKVDANIEEDVKVANCLELKEINDGVKMSGLKEDIDGNETKSMEVTDIIEGMDTEDSIKVYDMAVSLPEENKSKEDRNEQKTSRRQLSTETTTNKCPECETVFSSRSNMVKHYRSKHEGIKYPCTHCDYQATALYHLQTHIQSKHKSKIFPCNQCDYHAIDKKFLQRHIQSKHDCIKYPCTQCDYQATRKAYLNTHIRNEHKHERTLNTSKNKESILCSECGAVFKGYGAMCRHHRSKHEGVRYSCNQCDYQALQNSQLRIHIESVHEGIKYPCNQCDHQSAYPSDLRRHMIARHSETILKCDSCDFQTKWSQNYYTHRKIHL